MTSEKYLLSLDAITKNHISRVTIQIWELKYVYNKKRKEKLNTPKPYGTGILIDYMGRKFIFSAKHVTENRSDDHPLYIRTGENEFSTLVGKVGMMNSTDITGIDLAYIDLNDDLVRKINGIQNKNFLDAEHIGYGGSLGENEPVVAMGFPVLNTKVGKYDLSISTTGSIWLLKGVADKIYNKYEIDKAFIYGLNYHGAKLGILNKDKSKKIDPEGISGGGVWKIWAQPFMGEELIRYHLIGILTKYEKNKYHVLWANRIELLMEFINRAYGFPLTLESIK